MPHGDPQPSTAASTRTKMAPDVPSIRPSEEKALFGPLEMSLVALAVVLLAMVVWLIA
jgi:hypothetical protein